MKLIHRFLALVMIIVALGFADSARAQYSVWHGPRGGYVYYPPTTWVGPPYGYYYGPVAPYYRPLPPYGFGSPYYNGYNDAYSWRYGPGVGQFLRMGGADFYGW